VVGAETPVAVRAGQALVAVPQGPRHSLELGCCATWGLSTVADHQGAWYSRSARTAELKADMHEAQ
jgi:hypothetical protein